MLSCGGTALVQDWMLIFFSFYLFKAPVTYTNLIGYAFCCTGVSAMHPLCTLCISPMA